MPFRRSAAARGAAGGPAGWRRPGRAVVLWADSFSDGFDPGVAAAALAVLRGAGYQVIIPDGPACCGLTWISTGQLDGARRRLGRLLATLGPYAEAGTPIVGLEPSCTAVLRSDLADLFPGEPRAAAVAGATRTLAELLTAPPPLGPGPDWTPPEPGRPGGHRPAALPPLLGHGLRRRPGAAGPGRGERAHPGRVLRAGRQLRHGTRPLRGVGRGGGDTRCSRRCARPPPGAVYLADGFSCRTQASQLAGVRGMHLAELLASRLPAGAGR